MRARIAPEERKMRTHHRTRHLSARAHRGPRSHRVLPAIAGQCFEIEIGQEIGGWTVRIPEIKDNTWAPTRAAVELAARECIAGRTGIPLGYISVWVRD